MKHLILSWLVLVGVQFSAQGDAPSVHGMLIFGAEKIYVSHLPMYHKPHDYQLILQVSLGDQQPKLVEDMKNNPNEAVYTVEPDTFVLPEMVKQMKPFNAIIYRGHFERHGKPLFKATIQPQQVVFFKKLNANEEKPKALSLIVFGTASEGFAAHHITARPNFDQVVKVIGLTADLNPKLEVASAVDSEPMKNGQELGPQIRAEKKIHLEHGDLEN